MDLYPAIDLLGGRCVRLVEGDFGQATRYGDDPVAVAESFAIAGARWIHVVDLDAARAGTAANRPLIARIAGAVRAAGVSVQTGGGVRTVDDATELIELGVERVVLGTAAVRDPAVVAAVAQRWPGRAAVGLDHRGGEVRIQGWTERGGRSVGDLVPDVVAAGAVAVIVTDISRDGRLAGPDVDGLADLCSSTGAPVIASGGVSSMQDLADLAAVPGLVGVVVGKAIYEGRVDVAAAVSLLAGPPA